MFAPALRIAIAKTDGIVSSEALAFALVDAVSLERVESEFESKINSSKAKRGEKPTKLAKSRQAEVNQYAADAAAFQADQLATFEEMSCAAIVVVLKSGLDSDLRFWANAAKYTHPADLPVVEEFVNAKRALQKSLAACLAGPSTSAA
jgi:hypothetical protein